jgi:hypothetical protein
MTDTDSAMAEFLAEHPRLMGALFTVLMLLSQAGSVVAQNSAEFQGP